MADFDPRSIARAAAGATHDQNFTRVNQWVSVLRPHVDDTSLASWTSIAELLLTHGFDGTAGQTQRLARDVRNTLIVTLNLNLSPPTGEVTFGPLLTALRASREPPPPAPQSAVIQALVAARDYRPTPTAATVAQLPAEGSLLPADASQHSAGRPLLPADAAQHSAGGPLSPVNAPHVPHVHQTSVDVPQTPETSKRKRQGSSGPGEVASKKGPGKSAATKAINLGTANDFTNSQNIHMSCTRMHGSDRRELDSRQVLQAYEQRCTYHVFLQAEYKLLFLWMRERIPGFSTESAF